ncbi:unnamed protein product, partial [Phaeothamnion confervicola]
WRRPVGSREGGARAAATPRRALETTVLLEELGRGGGGTVYKAVHVPSLRLVAVKTVAVHDDSQRHQVVRELRAMHSVNMAPLPATPATAAVAAAAVAAAEAEADVEADAVAGPLGVAKAAEGDGKGRSVAGSNGGGGSVLAWPAGGPTRPVEPSVLPGSGGRGSNSDGEALPRVSMVRDTGPIRRNRSFVDVDLATSQERLAGIGGGSGGSASGTGGGGGGVDTGSDRTSREDTGSNLSPALGGAELELPAAAAAMVARGETARSSALRGNGNCGLDGADPAAAGGSSTGGGGGSGRTQQQQPPPPPPKARRPCNYIVTFHNAYTDPEKGCVGMVMEFMGAGTLQQFVQRRQALAEPALAVVARSVLKGLAEMHERHRIHRDIKPSNILVGRDGRVKISDFGVARELNATASLASTFTGTLTYMSPERISNESYSYPSDIWSLGLVVVTLARGAFPLATGGGYWAVFQAIQEGPSPALDPAVFGADLCDFCAAMLQRDPRGRASARKLLRHPFLLRHGSARRAPELAAAAPPASPARLDAVAEAVAAHYVASTLG